MAPSLALPPVESESRAAIGASWKQVPLASGSKDPHREECGDGFSSLEPGRNRRHGEPGILSQERHESRDVRLLPQGHIAIKQGVYMGSHFRHSADATRAGLAVKRN